VRLIEAKVRNYRVHRDLHVRFEGNPVLVRGPNESGKSTLIEAIHRALFLRARGTGEAHAEMKSDHGGDPSVELQFVAGGITYELNKVFSGNSGKATLSAPGMQTLTGDAAEEKLAALLGFGEPLAGKRAVSALPRRWAHLWVRQGTSSESPLSAIEECQTDLQRNLRARSGMGLLMSDLDARLITSLRNWVEETYTANGQFRRNSAVRDAMDALESRQAELSEKRSNLEKLREAARDIAESAEELQALEIDTEATRKQLDRTQNGLLEVDKARKQLELEKQEYDATANQLAELETADRKIHSEEQELAKAQEEAKPVREELDRLGHAVTASSSQLQQIMRRREKASEDAARSRLLLESWKAHLGCLQTSERLAELIELETRVKELQEAEELAISQLAKLRPFTPEKIKKLRQLQRAAERARSRFEAYALRLDVLAAGEPVIVNGQSVSEREALTISEVVEVQVGDTRLRLTPGAADDLDTARAEETAARRACDEALRECGASSLEQAERSAEKRSHAESHLKSIRDRIQSLNPEQVSKQIAQLREELEELKARRSQNSEPPEAPEFTDSIEQTRNALSALETRARDAMETEASAASEEKAARETERKLKEQLDRTRDRADEKARHEATLTTRLELERERWGSAPERAKKLASLKEKRDALQSAVSNRQKVLDALGPEQLDLDRQRLEQGLQNSATRTQAARDRYVAARTLLEGIGTTDPESQVKEIEAETERLERRCSALTSEAETRRFLLEQLEAARNASASALSRPLDQIASRYLQDIFGPGTLSTLGWSDDGNSLETLQLDRTPSEAGVHPFAQLSFGTRQQVGLALRLSIAEILAADFDGCLPIVLDDAFTHADRNRIQLLQRLLFRVAQHGLQIIILTCHPENYAGLTPTEIRLPKTPEPNP